jgi:hypothetical protein
LPPRCGDLDRRRREVEDTGLGGRCRDGSGGELAKLAAQQAVLSSRFLPL